MGRLIHPGRHLHAGFGFVYWLHHNGGLTKRTYYQVRFEGPVSGLQTGAPVQFNGIRVGEVTNLGLDPGDPSKVVAKIGIASGVPVKADTKVDINVPGLTGTPEISLRGGTASAHAQGSETNPPVLVADAAAGQDVMQAARSALQRLNKILSDNSGRIDGILAGLEHFVGGTGAEKPKPIYDITLPDTAPKPSTPPTAQFVVTDPTATVVLQTRAFWRARTTVRSPSSATRNGATHCRSSFRKRSSRALKCRIPGLGPAAGRSGDRQLPASGRSADLRDRLNPNPAANIEFSVKIVAEDGHVVGAKNFHASVPTKDMETPSLVEAFNQAFGQAAGELVAWTTKTIAS